MTDRLKEQMKYPAAAVIAFIVAALFALILRKLHLSDFLVGWISGGAFWVTYLILVEIYKKSKS